MQMRERSEDDLPAVRELLVEAALPVEGLEATCGWVALSDAQMVGHIAREEFGDAIVLRSLVVVPEARGQGIARSLLRHAERQCAGKTVYLRTRTINAWIERLGYQAIGLDEVPGELQASPEFGGTICTSVPIYAKSACL